MGLRYLLAATIVLAMSPVMAWSQARLSGDAELIVTYEEFFSTKELLSLQSNSPWLDLSAALSINSDGKYGADIANFKDHQDFFHNYFLMESGFTQLHFDTLGLQLGRIPQVDPFGGPYSLFVNSSRPSALGAVLSYRDSVFSYESRWIQLNSRSNMGVDAPEAWSDAKGFPDRGANIKTLMFHVGDQTLGIQDAAVYTKRNFDLEYFVSPMPEYFTQYFYGTAGRPWTTSTNENNLIGFFWKLHRPEWNLGAQVLIDDFSLHFLLPSAVPNNPWKAAWTVGGDVATAWGTFGLHHAGALKYTFEPIDARRGDEAGSAYGYTFYPDTRYGA
jgi:hypothetical protein